MVTTGFSRIFVAKYTHTPGETGQAGTVAYTGCRELARARGMSTDVSTSNDNNYYANNRLAETETGAAFSDGTGTLTVDGLSSEEEAFIMGLDSSISSVTVGAEEIESYNYGEAMDPPYLGLGAVKKYQFNGKTSYRPIVFTKVKFNVPADDAETEEDSVSWQDQELEFVIMRDDTASENWKRIPKENFNTESEAVAYIIACLGGISA